jgi:hypothetical protein
MTIGLLSFVSLPTLRNFVAEGDSITDSQNVKTSAGGGYANAGFMLASPAMTTSFVNMAVSGSGIGDVMNRAAATDTHLVPGAKNILSVFIGANNTPDATFLASLAAYCDARRAAGWFVLLGTLLPQIVNVNFNGLRATANPEIRLWTTNGSVVPGKHADGIFDFAADPIMGNDATPSNTTYFVDGLHPTLLGQSRMRDIFSPVLDAAMSNITTNPTLTSVSSYTTEAGSPDTLIQLRADRGVTWSISGDAAIVMQETSQLLLNTVVPGTYTTAVTMTDGGGRVSVQQFAWTVASPPSGFGPNLVINGGALLGLFGWTNGGETLWFESANALEFTIEDHAGGGKKFVVHGSGGGFPQSPSVTLPTTSGATYQAAATVRVAAPTSGTPTFRVTGSTEAAIGTLNTTDTPLTGTLVSGGSTIAALFFINAVAESGSADFSELAVRQQL